jgi:hypothetical protein
VSGSERITLVFRVTMETGIVVALGFWGYHVGGVALMIAIPVVGFGLWGSVDLHQAGRLAEPMRLAQELVISGLAALAWYAAGHHAAGIALGGLSILYHALVYATGARLLKVRRVSPGQSDVQNRATRSAPVAAVDIVESDPPRRSDG